MSGSLLILCIMMSVPRSMDTKRILLLPYSFGSIAKQFSIVGEGLANAGHEVYMALADSLPEKHRFMGGKVKLIIHESREIDFFNMGPEKLGKFIMEMKRNGDFVKSYRENHEEWLHMCTNPLSDERFYNTLKGMNFDFAIVHIYAISRCLQILPYSLGIPYAGLTTMYEPWLSRSPQFPSVVPSNLLGKVYSDHMNFWERLGNLWQNVDWVAFTRVNFLADENMKKFFRNKEVISLNALTARCLLFLIDVDPLVDYPRPTLPNEINIGGLSTQPAKPLPADLKEYMDSAHEGVILVTFGSTSFSLDNESYLEFMKAFAQIKQKILWKYNGEVTTDLSSNVKVLQWLPQNDILGHRNTKIFITHCGNNGQMEALYHGIPMIGFPFFADQPYNCKRMAAHGFGIYPQQSKFKAQHLVNAVNEILSNDSYYRNIKHASNIFKESHFTPLDRAVYWIGHVMKYGGDHIHSHALDMPWYEYLMVDIAMFIFMMLLIVMIALVYLANILRRYCNRRHVKLE